MNREITFEDFLVLAKVGDEEARQHLRDGKPLPRNAVRNHDRMIGQTRLIFVVNDADVLKQMPDFVKRALNERPETDNLVFRWIDRCHLRCWLRETEIHPELGRWTYIEVKMPPKLLLFPQSKSTRAFARGLTAAYAMMSRSFAKEAHLFKQEMEWMLDPNIKWREPVHVWKAEGTTPKRKKLTARQLLIDMLEELGNRESLGGGEHMIREMGPVLASLHWSEDATKEMTPEAYEAMRKELSAELPAFRQHILNMAKGGMPPMPEALRKAPNN